MSTWTITDAINGRELGKIKNKLKFIGSKMVADGEFGHYTIKGKLGNHSFTISKNKHKVKIYFIVNNRINKLMFF